MRVNKDSDDQDEGVLPGTTSASARKQWEKRMMMMRGRDEDESESERHPTHFIHHLGYTKDLLTINLRCRCGVGKSAKGKSGNEHTLFGMGNLGIGDSPCLPPLCRPKALKLN